MAYEFVEFPWQPDPPDPRRDRLCASPVPDRVRIDCTIEGESFAAEAAPQDEITVLAYNVERGLRAAEQIEMLSSDPSIPDPDVLLLNEVDRGCERSGWGSVVREYAKALGMCYVYGVEFIELPRFWGPGGGRLSSRCEHGNAVLSRYPLGNVRLIRHEKNLSWYSWWQRLLRVGEPRMGGRMALAADVKIGERYLHLYSLHLESRQEDEYRSAQSAEVAEDGLRQPFGVIAGGDLNCVRYIDDLRAETSDDPVTQALIQRGYVDAHAALPVEDRVTTRSGVAIDLIVGRGVTLLGGGIGSKDIWGELSNHLPVWTKLRLQ